MKVAAALQRDPTGIARRGSLPDHGRAAQDAHPEQSQRSGLEDAREIAGQRRCTPHW